MQPTRWWSAAVLAATLGVASCGGTSAQDAARTEESLALAQKEQQPEAVTEMPRKIFPIDTGPEIDWVPSNNAGNAQHYVWVPAPERRNGKLFVFLPGANNKPMDHQYFSGEAARAGYHVIGLMYRNDTAIEVVCPGNPDENCSSDMRHEILLGVDPPADISKNVTVNVANSIDYRLTKLLGHLDRAFPHEGWSRFLKHGEPKWSRIAVSGQSQGAGQAALIAQLRRVPRVVMLSGPPDSRIANQVPAVVDSWVQIGATSASRHFALYHHRDKFVIGPPTGTMGITTNLSALGLDQFGPPVAVGTGGPFCTNDVLSPLSDSSFGQTHLLTTDLVPVGGCAGAGPGNPHRSTGRDDTTPLAADGTPRLLSAWRYLIGPADDDGQDADADG